MGAQQQLHLLLLEKDFAGLKYALLFSGRVNKTADWQV